MRNAILINDTSNEHHIGSSLVVNLIEDLCLSKDIKIVQKLTRAQIEKESYVKQMLNAENIDFILVNGEGSLHRCPPFFYKLLKILPSGKKNILLNSIWEKMVLRNKEDLNKFQLISVRESKSYEEIKKIYKGELVITPDIVFHYKPKDNIKIDICYGDSVLTGLRNQLKTQLNYFPLNYEGSSPSIETYLRWIRNFKLYVTGRFHGLCLSAIANQPFLVFASNSHKIEGILKDMDCEELLIKNFSEIKDKHKTAKELIKKAHDYAKKAPERIDKLFERISEL